jgi:hypothetical protein
MTAEQKQGPVRHDITGILSGKKVILSEYAPDKFFEWLNTSGAEIHKYRSLDTVSDIGDHADTGILRLVDRSFKEHYFTAPSVKDAAKWIRPDIKLSTDSHEKIFVQGEIDPCSPYPDDTVYNMVQVRNREKWYLVVGTRTDMMPCISEFCIKNRITIRTVNQGYVRCNALVADLFRDSKLYSDTPLKTIKTHLMTESETNCEYHSAASHCQVSSVITNDPSLKTLLQELEIPFLEPPEAEVALRNYNRGFFAGACGLCEQGIIVCGSAGALTPLQTRQLEKIAEITGFPFYMPEGKDLKITDIGSVFIL